VPGEKIKYKKERGGSLLFFIVRGQLHMLIRLVEQDAEDELGSMSGSDTDDGEDTGLYDEEDNYMEHHQLEGNAYHRVCFS
jgi:hypothetical protein